MQGKRHLALVGLGLGLALGGCGDGGAGTPTAATDSAEPSASSTSTTPAEPPTSQAGAGVPADAPSCMDTWTDGAKLPRVYAGCVSDAQFIARDVLECSSGQRLVRFDESFYAVLGGTIVAAQKSPLKKDAGYRDVVAACRA